MKGISELTGTEKAAALFLIMGKDSAVRLAEFFSKGELNMVVEAARRMSGLSSSNADSLIEEFGDNYQIYGIMAGSEDLSMLFEDDAEPSLKSKSEPLSSNEPNLDSEVVRIFLESEAPQIGALLLDRLGDELIVSVFADLDPILRNEIFQAYLTGNRIEPTLQNMFETDLIELMEDTKPDDGNVREVAKAASLINQFSSEASDQIIGFLQGNSPDLATAIKKSLFKFSTVELLSKEDRNALFDGVQADEIVKALSTTGESNREAVLEVLSPRNRRMVESDLTRMATPEDEAEKAQKAIAVRALKLAKDGKINLPEVD